MTPGLIRRRAPLAAACAALAAGLASSPAVAQGAAAVAGCRAVTDPVDRIACLEAALLAEEAAKAAEAPAPGEAPAPAPAASAAAAPAPVAAPAPAPSPAVAAAAPSAERRGFGLPFIGDEAPQGPEVASSAPEAAEMGAEQVATVRERAATTPRMTARVVAVQVVPYRRLQVELDNGQIWRQLDSDGGWDEARYEAPSHVEIRPSRFGGYRMTIEDPDLELKVERIR